MKRPKATKITVVMSTGHGRSYTYTLSEAQAYEIRGNDRIGANPNGDPKDREPEKWIRMANIPTVESLIRAGLAIHRYHDWPQGWCAELTASGLAVRKALNESVHVIGIDGTLNPPIRP